MPKEFAIDLDLAVRQHRRWKAQLMLDADRGSTRHDPELVRVDSNCELGKWIHSRLPTAFTTDPYFIRIKDLHQKFHLEASKVVSLIRAGRSADASAEMERGSYGLTSVELVRVITKWTIELREKERTAR